jgi:hypothetical protein
MPDTAQSNPVKPIHKPVLFNGDCTFFFGESYQVNHQGRYSIDTIHRFIDMLGGSGVDVYLQNPNAQKPWYPSKAVPSVTKGYQRGGREFFRDHFPPVNATTFPEEELNRGMDACTAVLDRHLDLQEDGIDWVEEVALACRRNNIKPWLSVRMNDAHGSENWEKSFFNCELQRNPRYRLSGRESGTDGPVNTWNQLLDYSHREVRDYYFAMIRELVEDYDYEGLELDWMRDPCCCEAPVAQKTLELMTEWIADIRELTRRKAEQTGHPYPLGLRIPVRLDALKSIGLDVATFAREGLIDFIAPSNYWQTTWDVPYEKLRATLGEEVAIYGVIEDAPNWLECCYDPNVAGLDGFSPSHRCLSASTELLRGNAAGKLAQGADGVYLYNFFCTDEPTHNPNLPTPQAQYPALKGLTDLEALRSQSKHYTLATANDARMRRAFEFADQLPITLEPGDQHAFSLSMCAEPDAELSNLLELVVQVVVEKRDEAPPFVVRFNGSLPNGEVRATDELLFPTGIFTRHMPKNEAWDVHFMARDIKEGWNELLILNGHSGTARIVSLELAVRKPH